MNFIQQIKKYHRDELLTNLDQPMLNQLIERILLQDLKDVVGVFELSKWSATTEDAAYEWLSDLPFTENEKARLALEYVYDKALNNIYENAEEIILKIHGITSDKKAGLGKDYILEKFKLYKDKEEFKILSTRLLILLSVLDDKIDDSFWDTEINLETQAHFAPAYVSAFKKSNPFKALSELKKIDNNEVSVDEKTTKMLVAQLESSLYFPLSSSRGIELDEVKEKIISFAKSIKSKWLRSAFEAAINDSYFGRNFNDFKKGFLFYLEEEPEEETALLEVAMKYKSERKGKYGEYAKDLLEDYANIGELLKFSYSDT